MDDSGKTVVGLSGDAVPFSQAREPRRRFVKKMNWKLGVAVVASIAIAAALAGCDRGGAGSAKILKLAFVTNNASDFWKIAAAGVHKYEQEAKIQVDIKMPPSGKTEEQNQILENLASQGTTPSPSARSHPMIR